MQKFALAFVISLLSIPLLAQTNLYENPKFAEISKSHHIIAIIPFKSSVFPQTEVSDQGKSSNENAQSAIYSWFHRRQQRGKLRIQVQDINTTNDLLKNRGIDISCLDQYTPKEIAQILGVDAVITGKFDTRQSVSEETTGVLRKLMNPPKKTVEATLKLLVYNGADGQFLVDYNNRITALSGSRTGELIDMLMQNISRRVSYTKY